MLAKWLASSAGMKRLTSGTKRQCDRALAEPPRRARVGVAALHCERCGYRGVRQAQREDGGRDDPAAHVVRPRPREPAARRVARARPDAVRHRECGAGCRASGPASVASGVARCRAGVCCKRIS
jgi:hypothetical protein